MRRAAAILACALALAGCRAPAGSPSWFPRVPGAVWVYELHTAEGRSEVRVKALGEREIPERDLRVFLTEETRARDGRFDPVIPVGYVEEGGYLARLTDLAYDGEGRLRVLGDGEPTWMLPLDPRPGQRWTQQTRLFAAGDRGKTQRWEAEVRSLEAIEVPAGRFGDVVEVRSALRDGDGIVVGRYRDVFARDVGLVYSLALGPGGDPSSGAEMRLLRYQIR